MEKMKNLTVEKIAAACNGKIFTTENNINIEVSNIVTDNRKVTEGSVFIAIKGERVDGHSFIESAYCNGAICVISEQELNTENTYILVENSLQAIKDIAAYYRKSLNVKVVGITGSVGKTSTKEMIYSVLNTKFNVLKTEGNFNNELGLPLTIFRLREEHQIAVLEMGISDFGEMTRLSAIAKPDVEVITNIGLCHLENLKTRDGILKAKTEMFANLKENGHIVLNGDDDKLVTVTDYKGIKPEFYNVYYDDESSNIKNNGIYADHIYNEGIRGIKCTIHIGDNEINPMINIPGNHMVYNATAAACVGKIFGIEDDDILKGIEELRPVSGRNNIIDCNGITVIDDCYNANPVSMKASIDVLNFAQTRKVAILGDMFELGDNTENLHENIGKYIAESGIDVVVLIGKLMNNAYSYLLNKNCEKKLYYFDNLDLMFGEIERIIEKGDTVLVKASNGMHFNKIVEYLKER